MNGAAIPGLPGNPPTLGGGPAPAPMPPTAPAAAMPMRVADPEPLPQIDESKLLQIMQQCYERSRSARETRKRLNRRNWDALHGKFDFLAKKKPGQSMIVIPSLETSLEQVCAQLTEQLVGFKNWFTASYEGDVPPIPGLDADEAAKILGIELERLAVDSGCMPTTYGMHRLVYDTLKLGLLESEITWKVSMVADHAPKYEMFQGEMVITDEESQRLRIDVVPFEDFFPDPSAAKQYMIHEIEVPISELPDLGFTTEQIDQMRHASPGTEKLEEQRRRSGMANAMPSPLNRVLLREYWGDLIDPQTGDLLARACTFMTAANTYVCKPPERIRDLYWSGLRPFIHVPLLPTPTAEVHHAFCDIAVPLVEAECELFNLLCDAGFHGALGVREVHPYKYENAEEIAKGITAGMQMNRLEGSGDDPGIAKIDTGTLTADMQVVYDRIARTRQEALRTNDLQLGRQAVRKTSATEINEISQASDDLFSNMALRFEDTAIEPLLELCWCFIWQFADAPMAKRIGTVLSPLPAETVAILTPEERFVAFANHVSFKAQGYKYQLQSVKDIQTIMQAYQMALQNPALMQVLQQRMDPVKIFQMLFRSRGVDVSDLAPDAQSMPMDPMLMQGQAGNPQQGPSAGTNPAAAPLNGSAQEQMMPPNQPGERGIQMP